MKFNDNIVTHIPTECLIEDYQALVKARNADDWNEVECVMECLADAIRQYTKVPSALHIHPSGNSAIAMSVENGIITDDNGNDLKCRKGFPLSDSEFCTGDLGAPGSEDLCPFFAIGLCDPSACQIALQGERTYIPFDFDGEIVLRKNGYVRFKKR